MGWDPIAQTLELIGCLLEKQEQQQAQVLVNRKLARIHCNLEDVRIPKMTQDNDLESYLETFERMAIVNHLDQSQ